MRPVKVRMAAAGYSQWIPVNRLQSNFNVSIAVVVSSGGVLTYTVQHTFDDIHAYSDRKITRSTTVATVNYTNHGLSVGDWAAVQGTGDSNLDGFQTVASVVDANNFTYTVSNTGATAAIGQVSIARVFPNLTMAGVSTSQDGNYVNPIMACRLYVSAYTSGSAELLVLQGFGT